MSISNLLADSITRIRNAQRKKFDTVLLNKSNFILSFLKVLNDEGYITAFEVINKNSFEQINVHLKYFQGTPVISEIQMVSKPGRRVYSSIEALPKVKNGLGINVLSTSAGVMSDLLARKKNVGGEVLCYVY